MAQSDIFGQLTAGSLRIFNLIQKQAPIAKSDLCLLTDKKITTINRMIEPLEQAGLVVECGTGDSTGGRKPMLYAVCREGHYVGAVNISTTYCEVAIINFRMEMLAAEKFAISPSLTPQWVVEKVTELFHSQLDALQIKKEHLHGVGVSIFSSFDRETGRIHRPTILYLNEEWLAYPLIESLRERLQLPIVVEKGTNAAATLEYFYGKGKGITRMLYILCAMNIRSAVVANGQLMSIAPRYEDAFGHMTIDFDGEECPCGNYGCVDCYTTIPAILGKAAIEIKKGRPTSLEGLASKLTFIDVCRAAEQGDSLATDVITSAASTLGTALANYINLFCPDLVILSGLLVRESNLYYDVAVQTAQRKSIFMADSSPIQFARNGYFSDPITVGAGSMMIESLIANDGF